MSRNLGILEDFIIIFLFIFGLHLPTIGSSSFVLFFILPLRLICNCGALNKFSYIINSKYILSLIGIYLILICITVGTATLHQTFDISLLKTLINSIVHLVIATMIVSILLIKGRTIKYLITLFIAIFFVQSLIEMGAFINKSILSFVQTFQTEATITRAALYSGRRGLALAGTVFFGLSSIYGLIFIFTAKYFLENPKINFTGVLVVCTIIVGAFFSGRTFFIGIAVSIMYIISTKVFGVNKMYLFVKLTLYTIVIILFAVTLVPVEYYAQINNLFLFVFEMFFNFIDTGSFTTTSSAHLTEDMYFPIALKTIICGDGMYSDPNGGYYMNTDAGYMRNILFFGIPGLVICILSDIYLMWGTKKLRNNKSISRFSLWVFIYLCILHYKGETFGYLITLHAMLFLYYIFNNFSHSNDNKYFDMHIQLRY